MPKTITSVPADAAVAMPAPAALPALQEFPPGQPSEGFDRWLHAQLGRMSAGISPAALLLAWVDWLSHLSLSPAKQAELVHKAWRKALRLALYMPHALSQDACCIDPLPQDKRFTDPAWRQWPFNLVSQSFLLTQQWWHNATTGVRGMSRHHEEVVNFIARQCLDVLSPSNFMATNPQVLARTLATGGANLAQGWMHWWDDWKRREAGRPAAGSEDFTVGANLAVTPGKVVMRNALAELIQYEPATPRVHAQPILILPAWIMKYYVLDLQPHNSLIRYLVNQGHTVFCVSWKNPDAGDRDFGMEDYLRLGLFESLDAVRAIVPGQSVHGVGYCLGGTLLSIGAAAMARDNDRRLASLSLLAAQTDFSEPGEIALFVDDSEVHFLEDMMFDRGYLSSGQMAGAFQMLRSNDLLWSRGVRDYLMGERTPMTDLMAWNQDATRMPYRMHSEYLHWLFLNNDLATGRFRVGSRPVALNDVQLPIFCLGTEADHVAPWRSVFKLHLLTDAQISFVLASGGHNVGVVSPPGHAGRHHRVYTRAERGKHIDADTFLARAELREGSWWTTWLAWLGTHGRRSAAPPPMGRARAGYPVLCDAPGTYVHIR